MGKKDWKTALNAPQGEQSPGLHAVDEETEDQRGSVECPNPRRPSVPEPGLKPS